MADRAGRIQEIFPEIGAITNPEVAKKVVDIWVEAWEEGGWDDPAMVSKGEMAPHRLLVPHTRAVVKNALAIVDSTESFHGIALDRDTVICMALLHDVGKVVEQSSCTTGSYAKSPLGRMMHHGSYGAHRALEKGLGVEIAHGVQSHTPWVSGKPPSTPEAIVVHYADMVDSDMLYLDAGRKTIVERRW